MIIPNCEDPKFKDLDFQHIENLTFKCDCYWEDANCKYMLKKYADKKEIDLFKYLNNKGVTWCPNLIYFNNDYLVMEHCGYPVSVHNIPILYQSMIETLLNELKDLGIKHNNICSPIFNNLFVKQDKLYLLNYDFLSIDSKYWFGENHLITIPDEYIIAYLDNVWIEKKKNERLFYFIINHNRLDVLKKEIESIRKQKEDVEMLVIVDHNSKYQPLLDYYHSIKDDPWINVVMKKDKYYDGPKEPNVNPARVGYQHMLNVVREYHKKYNFSYFAKCDPDCEIPYVYRYFSHLINISAFHKHKYQVGPALRLDDIPENYPMREQNANWEKKFWMKWTERNFQINGYKYTYYLPNTIDGTLSVFHVDTFLHKLTPFFCYSTLFPACRVAGDFQLRHLDWYNTKPTKELIYYTKSAGTSASHCNNWVLDKLDDEEN